MPYPPSDDAPHADEITAPALAERLRAPDPPLLIDVREPWEHGIAHLPGARLVPLDSVPAALSTLDPAREYVIYCHHGVRSLAAAQFLKARGLRSVANLVGGIDAWAREVDPAVERY